MELWQSIVLGLIEGLTEYLPVSSTGHLIIAQQLMGIQKDTQELKAVADAFSICIQFGAILAVAFLYWKKWLSMGKGLVGKCPQGKRLLGVLIMAFIPAAIVGLSAGNLIKTTLFSPLPIASAWIGGGVVLWWMEKTHRTQETSLQVEAISWKKGLGIGLFQCLAVWPGVSRSLATIFGGISLKLPRKTAVEFSFFAWASHFNSCDSKRFF